MMALTNEQQRDLRAINGDPGRYSRCKEDGELMTLVNLGLIRWMETGGYEITPAGRAFLENAKDKAKVDRVADAIRDNIADALPRGVNIDYRYAAIAAIDAMK